MRDRRADHPAAVVDRGSGLHDDPRRLTRSAGGLAGAGATTEAAAKVGAALAEAAKKAGVTSVVFDRGGFLFHGRVKALADAAREGGLKF